MQRLAVQWSYVLRNRRRWNDDAALRADLERRVLEEVATVGLTRAQLQFVATAQIVEVSIPFVSEERGWEARIFPWEYVLSAVARSIDPERRITVLRRLDRRTGLTARHAQVPRVLLLVVSAPGQLADAYTFDNEEEIVIGCLGLPKKQRLLNPTLKQLEDAIALHKPDVIHLAGFDNHQGLALREEARDRSERSRRSADEDAREPASDGMVLAGEGSGEIRCLTAEKLAEVLNRARHKPMLVFCNFWNTAARVCPLIVAHGAGAAVGFQDAIDDTIAENFAGTFYRTWKLSRYNTPWAFHTAWQITRDEGPSREGSGVVLWQERALRDANRGERVHDRAAKKRATVFDVKRSRKPWPEVLEVTVRLKPALNYALLHNDRGIFQRFDVRKLVEGTVRGVRAEVILHVGNDNFPCLVVRDLENEITDFDACMRPALTSEILCRAPRESIRTAATVTLSCGGDIIYCDTHRTTLLPIDEWLDSDEERDWLPSFVLPRDPAVTRVIQAAQQHLMAILDDPSAGFDGYQRVNVFDPAGDPSIVVDPQVQAIWTAILHDLPVHYINPPPTFSMSSQRLRRPSDVILDHSGTCIDTALLLAACLEYVDIYPVLFLLKGHAFPGYWRSMEAHAAFVEARGRFGETGRGQEVNRDINEAIAAQRSPSAVRRRSHRWALGRENFVEVLRYIERQDLVPLESVLLTSNASFAEGANEGMQNLRDPDEFESLVDIKLARKHDVLPLPIHSVVVPS